MSVPQPDGRVSTFTGVGAGGWAGEGSLLEPGLWRYDGVVEFDRLHGPEARVARCLASLFDPALYPRSGSCVELRRRSEAPAKLGSEVDSNSERTGCERLSRSEPGGDRPAVGLLAPAHQRGPCTNWSGPGC